MANNEKAPNASDGDVKPSPSKSAGNVQCTQ